MECYFEGTTGRTERWKRQIDPNKKRGGHQDYLFFVVVFRPRPDRGTRRIWNVTEILSLLDAVGLYVKPVYKDSIENLECYNATL